MVHLLDGSRFSKGVCLINNKNGGCYQLLSGRTSADARLHLFESLGDELSHLADSTPSACHEAETKNRHLDPFAPRDRITETVRKRRLACSDIAGKQDEGRAIQKYVDARQLQS